MKLLKDLDVFGKKVFLRADLDVGEALNAQSLTTNARLLNIRPTVDYLFDHGARKVVIAGHIGRPQKPDQKLSTKNLINDLEKILSRSVTFRLDFAPDESGTLASMAQLVLFENLRFWPGETENDDDFAKQLANLADIYVNDAFGVCHRAHASIVGVPGLLPHAAGLHLEEEVNQLTKLIEDPSRPFVAIIGGAKIETKLPLIENLAKIADYVLVGGEIAKQLTTDKLPVTSDKGIEGQRNRVDRGTITESAKSAINRRTSVLIASLTGNGKDIDETSINKFKSVISKAKTIVWNGPMGVFEEGFERGTVAVAQAIVQSGVYSVVGGGETTQFLGSHGLLSQFSFVSSGGGAMLAFLAGHQLPGIKALE